MIDGCLSINEKGHLSIGGADTVDLAQKYRTPLYVMDENTIRDNLRNLKQAIDETCDNGGMVAFASKACSFLEMYRIVKDEGCGTDVVSCGEMATALHAGMPAEKIFFHGNNKTDDDLIYALDNGIGYIVVDNETELEVLSQIAEKMNKVQKVLLRITPGIDAHTHSFIKTGQIDSKFGFTLETGEALKGAKKALNCPNIELSGVHCHIGSQIFDEEPMKHAADVMIRFMNQVRVETGYTMPMLNLGGGFGIPYTDSDTPKKSHEYMRLIAEKAKETSTNLQYPMPFIVVEPGRSIVAPAGITLYTVGGVKNIPNIRTYVSVDGGMTDNPRYALYQADYTALVANKANQEKTEKVTIAGHCCESGDILQENIYIQECSRGDTIAFLTTGAYCYSMSSNYNRYPKPPVVMVKDGKSRVVVKRETYEDVMRNDI